MSLPGSATHLAVFRIALGLQIFYSSNSKLLELLQTVNGTRGTSTIFPVFIDNFVQAISFPYLTYIVIVLSVFLILGLFTRYILPILFISFLLLFGFWYSKFNAPVPWLYVWFPLLLLCFTRCADKWSLDKAFGFAREEIKNTQIYRWPIEVVTGWFAYIYVAAGIAKIIPFYKGLYWLDGATSQKIIHDRFLDSIWFYVFKKPLFDYTEHAWVFALLSIGSLLIELFCIVLFFTNRFNYLVISLVLIMHLFLYVTGVPGFMQLALVLGICLLPPKLFNLKLKK